MSEANLNDLPDYWHKGRTQEATVEGQAMGPVPAPADRAENGYLGAAGIVTLALVMAVVGLMYKSV
ncbi:hypothetical protein RSAG8_11313, partial [Rhizoctonia solani AG-8 WAC10335]